MSGPSRPESQRSEFAQRISHAVVRIGEIQITPSAGGFELRHREDQARHDLATFSVAEDAIGLARYDDDGKYRPLKTAPNLRPGWRLELADAAAVEMAIEGFYPGRLPVFEIWRNERLMPTDLRETLHRQSGMYRIAAKISDRQIEAAVGQVCRSDGGCLRTILWRRDGSGALPAVRLPSEKYDPFHDQTGGGEETVPLLCPEACNILIAAAREAVKGAIPE
ncbi:MAG TPA: DR2241 family protein [Chthoniobacterales bacterium]|nr:DR2241 family protein [Chthoniobacterales bacterium]